jgi:MFS family permease
MPFLVTAWGISTVGLAFSTNYGSLLACRFLLGLFEASCLPLFAMVTATWYRRQEQPLRVALWVRLLPLCFVGTVGALADTHCTKQYGTNGVASILGSLLAFCLSYIKEPTLHLYQILFLIVGLITVITGPILYWRLDNGPAFARFLTEEERGWAVQRVAENQGGKESTNVNWSQVWEALWSPITWAFVTLAFTNNTGASVT